ncbi:MAG: proline--tRNA ligase [Candidatus Altiarchaeota archaeon]
MGADDFSDWYHKILEDAEIIDIRFSIKGMPVYRRWGITMVREMQRFLEILLEDDGHEPVLFPVLIPEDVMGKESEHIAGFEEQVFWVTHAGGTPLERRMALRPTSETSMYDMFSLWIRSHTDLPLKIHQSVAVYRYETKHTRPLIRGREFLWNEGHTAFASEEDAEENIKTIIKIYGKLINELLCLPFQVNRRPDWDKFPGAVYTLAFETLMPDGRTLQLATAHNLGQNFSKPFNIAYEDAGGEHRLVYQTSYGPGFGRLLAAVISVHGDGKGMVLPPKIAPVQVVIVPVLFKDKDRKEVEEYSRSLVDSLKKQGFRVKLDDSDSRPGVKYYHWEMKGVPVRLEAGPREVKAGKVVAVRRDTGKKELVALDGLDITSIFKEIEDNLRKKAQKRFDERMFKAETLDDLKKHVGVGIATAGWCQTDDCAKSIDELGTILMMEDKPHTCAVCGGPGKLIRVARTY